MSPFAIGVAPEMLLPAAPRGIDEQRRLAGKSPLEVAREFEAMLVAQVISAMRQTVPSSDVLSGGAANKILDGAFDQELARSVVKDARLGLAEELAAQIARQQHAREGAAAEAPTVERAAPAGRSTATAAEHVAPDDGPARVEHIDRIARGRRSAEATDAVEAEGNAIAQLVGGAEGRVTSGYGVRRDPITGALAFHRGLDVAAPRGSTIHAAAAGEVIFSGRRGEAGTVVEVRHGDLVSTYAHLQRTLVKSGQKVAAGDVLATVGSSGRSTGPHLHFAVTRDGQTVDPATVLRPPPASAEPSAMARTTGEEG